LRQTGTETHHQLVEPGGSIWNLRVAVYLDLEGTPEKGKPIGTCRLRPREKLQMTMRITAEIAYEIVTGMRWGRSGNGGNGRRNGQPTQTTRLLGSSFIHSPGAEPS